MEKNEVASVDEGGSMVSFRDYLFKNEKNKKILISTSIVSLSLLSIFKYIYPFISYIYADSFAYLEGANKNMGINTYMIGYSMFLRIFSAFTRSDMALAIFQYLLIEISAILLLFTIFYFYSPRKTTQFLLLCFVVFNPLFFYLGNMVSSDGFFLALSLIWVTTLIWITQRPSLKLIIFHTVILYITFTVRYNALIYIAISALAFVLSPQSIRMKIGGISSAILSIGLFIIYTGNQYKELTGVWQYSPFAGWQLANNAMYAYRYVDSAERKPVPEKFKPLDNNIRAFFDSTRDTKKYPTEAVMASTYYMWSPGMPLFNYRNKLYSRDTNSTELKKWASIAPFYKEYGSYIIKQYPTYYVRYFLWPNTLKYYTPSVEFLTNYNSGKTEVAAIAKLWFGYKNNKVFSDQQL